MIEQYSRQRAICKKNALLLIRQANKNYDFSFANKAGKLRLFRASENVKRHSCQFSLFQLSSRASVRNLR
jgi:hypothetical protein